MNFFRMRNFGMLAGVALLFLVLFPAGPAYAGIPVIDGTNLVQNILSALQTIESVINQIDMISNQGQQIANQVKSIQTLGSGFYNQISSLSDANIDDLNNLLGTVKGIEFSAKNVSSQFDSMFPQGTDWDSIPLADFTDQFDKWNQSLTDSAKFSMNAQTVVNRVKENYSRMEGILSQSQGADGEVRQIQAANQSLGVISTQLGDITQTLVAGQRVTSTAAAVSAAETKAQAQATTRLRSNYANKGPSSTSYSTMPQPR